MLLVNFFRGLFNENGTVSSKRVVGFLAFCQMCVMANGEQFFEHPINMAIFGILFSLVCYCFSLNTLLQAKAMGIKKDVATDMVNNTKDNDSATNVLQSEKPSA